MLFLAVWLSDNAWVSSTNYSTSTGDCLRVTKRSVCNQPTCMVNSAWPPFRG